jgi:hypothetical protein
MRLQLRLKRGRRRRIKGSDGDYEETIPFFDVSRYDPEDVASDEELMRTACECILHTLRKSTTEKIIQPGQARDMQLEEEPELPKLSP